MDPCYNRNKGLYVRNCKKHIGGRGMIQTERLELLQAKVENIDKIIEIESHEDNRDYLWIGTYQEHLDEIADVNHLLLVFKEKLTAEIVGYALIRLDFKSNIFEIRRIAIVKKAWGMEKSP